MMRDLHILVRLGKEEFDKPREELIPLAEDAEANRLVNDLTDYPHAYVLACCMDRQVKTEMAWTIPYKIYKILGTFDIDTLYTVSNEGYRQIFNENKLHRFNDVMADIFFKAVHKIKDEYNGDASSIWAGNPSSSTVVYRFLQFDGVGVKIATMATNILARQFKVPLSDYYSIDVSPDTHVRCVMYRMGLIKKKASIEDIIFKARELYPEFPGIVDDPLFEIGKNWCKAQKPDCENCIAASECPKIISLNEKLNATKARKKRS